MMSSVIFKSCATAARRWPSSTVLMRNLTPRRLTLIVDMHLPRHDGDAILNRLRATRDGRRVRAGAMSGQFGPHFVAHEGLVCFSKPSTVDEFLRLGAIVRGLLLEGRRAEASGPQTGS